MVMQNLSLVQAADTISAARPGARRETLDTYTNRLKQLEDISNGFKGVEKSFAIQAGREIRIMVVPEQISDADMVLLARNIAKQIESELEYPGQIKVNVIRESRVTDFAKQLDKESIKEDLKRMDPVSNLLFYMKKRSIVIE